jgi:hypothetical protein
LCVREEEDEEKKQEGKGFSPKNSAAVVASQYFRNCFLSDESELTTLNKQPAQPNKKQQATLLQQAAHKTFISTKSL